MNPDVFSEIEVPPRLRSFVRRILVAWSDQPLEFTVHPSGTGYCYLGWTARGRWTASVNSEFDYDTDRDGQLHHSGQILGADIKLLFSGRLVQFFAELTAVGQFSHFGIAGEDNFERAVPVRFRNTDRPKFLQDRSQTIDAFCSFLESASVPSRDVPHHVVLAVTYLEECNGLSTVAEVARASGVTARTLGRDFSRIVGLSPKKFAQTLRINAALGKLMASGPADLAKLSAELGYADQAHMTRSFVKFLGDSPKALISDIEPTFAKFVGQSRERNLTCDR